MAQIVAYLTFNGNCREAMTFYKSCLGGELAMQSVGESQMANQMPKEAQNMIMHASLTNGSLALMASDMMRGGELVHGNAQSLLINCSSENEIKALFSTLSSVRGSI